MEDYPIFERWLRLKFLDAYDWKIRRPLMRRRANEIGQIKKRKDYNQMLVIEEKEDNEYYFNQRQELYVELHKTDDDFDPERAEMIETVKELAVRMCAASYRLGRILKQRVALVAKFNAAAKQAMPQA